MEKTTFNVTVVHFFLMLGYKLFSIYYPLYLVSLGLSVIKVGWVYLLIYGTIAVSILVVNFYIHKIDVAITTSLGIFGYGLYALLMLLNTGGWIFYTAQVLLGICAALWLVSLKSILIDSRPKNFNKSFGWFYSAPAYAEALAPAIGGLIIYKSGFKEVFILSFVIEFATAIWAYWSLRGLKKVKVFNLTAFKDNYKIVFSGLRKDKIALFAIFVLFILLILGGISSPFFILFLKDLNYSQSDIIIFFSMISLCFIPLSWVCIKYIAKFTSYKNIFFGVSINATVFVVIGLLWNFLNIVVLFLLLLIQNIAGLMSGSGKSAMLAEKFFKFKEETSAIDSFIGTSGTALGAIIGGVVISKIGFAYTFLYGGIIVLILSLIFYLFVRRRSLAV